MKSKKIRTLVAVVLSVSMLVGCAGTTTSGEKEEETVNVAVMQTQESTKEDIKEVTQEVSTVEATTHEEASVEIPKEYKEDGVTWQELLSDMGMGWNLGNTFDSIDCSWLNNELDYELAWIPDSNKAKTSKEMIQFVKASGFNTIRIPVSWHNHVEVTNDENGKKSFVINPEWLARVKEVVNYAYDEDMYIILNIHHDDESGQFIYPTDQLKDQSISYITAIWTTLATEFADYDLHLIFETYNEVRLAKTPDEWNANAENSKKAQLLMNEYAQAAVNSIRSIDKGYNESRFIFVPGYAASLDSYDNYVLPSDPGAYKNRIGVAVHAYTPYSFCMDRSENGNSVYNQSVYVSAMDVFKKINRYFTSNDIPAYVGEWGVISKEDNDESRVTYAMSWAEGSQTRCKDSDGSEVRIPTVLWDNGFLGKASENERYGYLDRKNLKWFDNAQPFVEAIMEGFNAGRK